MKKQTRLRINRDTVRILANNQLRPVIGGFQVASGSQGGPSVTCPPPHGGEGSGCVTG